MREGCRKTGGTKGPSLALVTGATGVIGPELIGCLLARGYRVRALVRRAPLPERISDVEIVRGDIRDRATLYRAVAGTDVIFHMAGKLHVNRPGPRDIAEYEAVNVEGASLLGRVAREASVRRFIFFSTINVYGGSRPGTLLGEDSPLAPDSLYAESKARAEQRVLNTLPAVVLRLAAVYGPNMKGNYLRLVNALQNKRFVLVGDGLNRRTLIHVRDVCEAAVLAAEASSAAGRVYNITDGQVHTLQEVIRAICVAMEIKEPSFTLPAGLARAVFGLFEDALGFFGLESPLGRSTIDKLTEDMAVSSDRIQRELGFKADYDLLTGWRECLRDMSLNG